MDKITMEDIMQWLEAQRTEVIFRLAALGDGDESHAEHSPEGKAVRIINAIVKRMGEMTAVEYLEAKTQMCKAYAGGYGRADCLHCPAVDCRIAEKHHPHRVIEIVKKWKEEQDGKA